MDIFYIQILHINTLLVFTLLWLVPWLILAQLADSRVPVSLDVLLLQPRSENHSHEAQNPSTELWKWAEELHLLLRRGWGTLLGKESACAGKRRSLGCAQAPGSSLDGGCRAGLGALSKPGLLKSTQQSGLLIEHHSLRNKQSVPHSTTGFLCDCANNTHFFLEWELFQGYVTLQTAEHWRLS